MKQTAACGVLVCMKTLPIAFCFAMLTAYVAAQSPATSVTPTPRLTFDVASIKRNVSGFSSIRVQPGQMVVTNRTLYSLMREAYLMHFFQMVPGPKVPSWIDSDGWDILAKVPADAPLVQEAMQFRLRSLLEDRFKLVTRREMREMPIYELVVARVDGHLGPQIRRSGDECAAWGRARQAGTTPPPMPPGGFCGTRLGGTVGTPSGTLSMKGFELSNFVRLLGELTGRLVIDKTGLSGPYDLDLQWMPDTAATPGAPQATPGDGVSLFAAMQEQLGLKLEAKRAPVEVLVIDSAERPTED